MILDELDFQKRKASQQLCLGHSVCREVRADSQDAIDIIRFEDIGDEATIDHKLLNARPSRSIVQPSKRFHLYSTKLRRFAESLGDFLQAGTVKAGWQESFLVQ